MKFKFPIYILVALTFILAAGCTSTHKQMQLLEASKKGDTATVQTLLRRLESKGYLRHRIRGKAHVFFSIVRSDKVIKRSVNDFIDRLFGGDPFPLMQCLAEHGKIDNDDIEKLKELIEKG